MQIEDIVLDSKKTIENFRQENPNGVVIIRGATATGKTKLSVLLSEHFEIEVISSDSRQFFRKMNIGTDKISEEIRQKLPHHQIDIIDPNQRYTAGQRKKAVEKQISEIQKKGKLAIIVGGTGLYIDTIYKNYTLPESSPNLKLREKLYAEEKAEPGILRQKLNKIDPQEAQKIHPNSTRYLVRALEIYEELGIPKSIACQEMPVQRPLLMIGLRRNKEDTNKLIDQRIGEMIKSGLIEEVQGLLDKGYDKDLQSMQGIGYKETVEYLEGKINKDELIEKIQIATHRLAKKQRSRFRRYIKDAQENPKKNVEYKVYEL